MSELLMALLLFSAVGVGLTTFAIGTAERYSKTTSDFEDFNATMNKYSFVSTKINDSYTALTQIKLENPMTWSNSVTIIFSVVSIMFAVPMAFTSILNDVGALFPGLVPPWLIWLVEGSILIIIIFGGIKLLSTGGEA